MVTKQQLLDDGSVWTTDNKWFRKCPSCGNVIEHTNYFNVRRLHLEKCICSKCAGKKRSIRQMGIRPKMSRKGCINSEESKRKVSLALKGIIRGPLSDEHRAKLSLVHTGLSNGPHSEITKKKIGMSNKGNIPWSKGKKMGPLSEDVKRQLRCAMLKKFLETGMATCIDVGANQWFNKYNREHNANFVPTPFPNTLGYDADGYDDRLHAWIEYDTKYHTLPHQAKKDLIRQNNIIRYFEDKGEPLTEFKRVLAYNNEEVKTVYRGYEYA